MSDIDMMQLGIAQWGLKLTEFCLISWLVNDTLWLIDDDNQRRVLSDLASDVEGWNAHSGWLWKEDMSSSQRWQLSEKWKDDVKKLIEHNIFQFS